MTGQPLTSESPEVAAAQASAVQRRLFDWYHVHGRDLPWRRTRDPYAILVAEVMLQQTQVERVIPKWHAWLQQFPTLAALATASRADAIRAWQGLGYNRRAVRLHQIASQAVSRFGGQLPPRLDALLSLPGIGRYTAGAVVCFAFEQPVAMVDTNIRRVLGRVFLGTPEPTDGRRAQALADAVVPGRGQDAYTWNQALMDLGATLCRAQQPLCLVCPLLGVCRARAGSTLPARNGRSQRKKQVPFEQTDRFLRGRIVDAVRALRPNEVLARGELAARLVPHAAEPARQQRVLAALAADGLIVLDQADGSVRLPS
jgi:A/G-specific adenine glycosylase